VQPASFLVFFLIDVRISPVLLGLRWCGGLFWAGNVRFFLLANKCRKNVGNGKYSVAEVWIVIGGVKLW
jgi:hypothetical protein